MSNSENQSDLSNHLLKSNRKNHQECIQDLNKSLQFDVSLNEKYFIKSEINQVLNCKLILSHMNISSEYCSQLDCQKILCKIEKVIDCSEIGSTDNVNEDSIFIMKKLNLLVGSKLKIKPLEKNLKCSEWNDVNVNIDSELKNEINSNLCNDLEQINKNVIQTVTNTLITGGLGTGKSTLLQALKENFSQNFIFVKMVCCKSIRGKKLETIIKIMTENLMKCSRQQPSVLLLDDLDALIYSYEDEDSPNKFYVERLVDTITSCIKEIQRNFNVSIIVSANSTDSLKNMVFTHGPRIFQNVQKIPDLCVQDKVFILDSLIRDRAKDVKLGSLNLYDIANKTNGYTIQDLCDLVNKSIFKCLIREKNSHLVQNDFDLTIAESTPLLLKKIKFKKNSGKKWDDIGGMNHPKNILMKVFSWPSQFPKLFESCPVKLHRGVLLYGAPGTGKTVLAGALANKCGLNFISVKGPEVLSKFVGASEEGIRNLFIQAQKTQPCLLFFDEFDSLAPKRGHDSTGVTDRVVNQLLTQLDGVEVLNGVWVLGATSRPDLIDPALLRPGRLDKLIFCPIPDESDRLSILNKLGKSMPMSPGIKIEEIAKKTEGYTGADLQAILYNAQMLAAKPNIENMKVEKEFQIEQNHLLEALKTTKPSLSKSEKLKYQNM
ncbi:peroxisome biogenesis factor, putative [Pediculus humanus corporis]|uniref:Peroxisomal ATPase PEX1 n=1 Tax=Pediculus humanus subsp. corporis TaxID=121224 RepID=E0VEL2_PEDHC|nr:peroxisome biogenesis factor, putative [Pediculus humanus corporis]EEB11818.1 peroxisome biogenesis factor, putative [Pediculus humanus corporis]